ncbi:hypothetical protein LVY72_14610 [Arthrobacter sp. I2-34]|uniref:Uncharacterized protein n=1 Tax=Arthrobacter hankyongi TaxID=2904801 RepID=A0ABS9L8X1_9MICC|nr:hypothetical protein [Arthrobacter hankyongi]MCG2623131.1 hypothetical protein [Arthrobacter hankyongi]
MEVVFITLAALAIITFTPVVVVRSEKRRRREKRESDAIIEAVRRREEAEWQKELVDLEHLQVELHGKPAAGTSRYAGTGRPGADRRSSGSAPRSSHTSGTDSSFDAPGAAIAASYISGSDSGSGCYPSNSSSSSYDSGSSSSSFDSGSSFSGGDAGCSF